MVIKENYIVAKRNILNEIRSNNMTLQELRFFSIYLSRINPQDANTRLVKFPLEDFQKIMDLGKININHIKVSIDGLLTKVVHIPCENGGFTAFQLFKECSFKKNIDNNEWFIEIDAHDKALPLMFDFKEKYFSYQLWNALSLNSSNQLRMYEILKQYEKIGSRIITVEELKTLLGINPSEYLRWDNLKLKVLEVCKKALEENTDIKFTYEPYGKKGRGGKILTLKFNIFKNKNFKNPINLEEFINEKSCVDFDNKIEIEKILLSEEEQEYKRIEDIENSFKNKNLLFFAEVCNYEFSEEEMQVFFNILAKYPLDENPPDYILKNNKKLQMYHSLKDKYDYLEMQSKKNKIKNRFGYLKKILEVEIEFDI